MNFYERHEHDLKEMEDYFRMYGPFTTIEAVMRTRVDVDETELEKTDVYRDGGTTVYVKKDGNCIIVPSCLYRTLNDTMYICNK